MYKISLLCWRPNRFGSTFLFFWPLLLAFLSYTSSLELFSCSCLSSVCLTPTPFLFICFNSSVSVCLSVCQSVCLSVYLSVSFCLRHSAPGEFGHTKVEVVWKMEAGGCVFIAYSAARSLAGQFGCVPWRGRVLFGGSGFVLFDSCLTPS